MFSDSNSEKNTKTISDYAKYKNDRKREKKVYIITLCVVYLITLLIMFLIYFGFQVNFILFLLILLITLGCYLTILIAIIISN